MVSAVFFPGLCALPALTLTGCGAKQAAVEYAPDRSRGFTAGQTAEWEGAGEASGASATAAADADGAAAAGDASRAVQTRKLVKNAELRLRVEDPEAAEKPVAAIMEKYGAYAAEVRIYDNSRTYTIRVPSASYEPLLAEVNGIGKILYRTESAEDVTLRYYDLEGRLATKQELLKTFQGYLGKAENIEEIMTVERRIAELQQEIDWTGTQLRSLADLVDYATVDLELRGPSSSSPSKPSAGERLSSLFRVFGDYASAVLVILTGIVIYGVPSVLILALLFWILFGRIGLLKKLWRLAAGKTIKHSAGGNSSVHIEKERADEHRDQ
jgi:hypothetical protein